MKEFRERRIMILMRIGLFATGAFFGALCMWQALDGFTFTFPLAAVILCYIASALFLGGLLCLSAPPVRVGFHKMSVTVRKWFKSVKAPDAAGVVLGLAVGLGVGLLSEFLFGFVLKILVLRILIDVALGFITAFVTSVAVSGWVSPPQKEGAVSVDAARGLKGYLITKRALASPKIVTLCGQWLDGNIYVLSRTADSLAAGGETPDEAGPAYEHFKTLYAAKKLRILASVDENDGGAAAYLEVAETKKLKIIASCDDEKLIASKRAVVLVLEDL
jgi:hypothetical protein